MARLEDEGFSLVELMVVVLIIAILIAIAIPQFIGARERGMDRAVQSDVRSGLTAEKTVYVDAQTFYANTVAVKAAEPSLPWGTKLLVQVGINTDPNDTVCLSERSKSGSWFAIGDIANTSATAPAGTYFTKSDVDPCTSDPATIATWDLHW